MSLIKINDDHIYYNCLFSNNTNNAQVARFSETRTSPFILNPSLYHVAIIRFTIPTYSIPLFIWKTVNNNQMTPDNNYYSFTMRYGLIQHTEYVQYIQTTQNPLPGAYSIHDLLTMLNITLNTLFNYMLNNAPGFPCTTPPYFTYDNTNNTINLTAETNYINVDLFTNVYTHQIFEYIPHAQLTNIVTGTDIKITIAKTGNNDTVTNCPIGVYGSVPAYIMRSEFNSLQSLQSLKSIIITSMNIKTKEEYIQNIRSINTDASLLIVSDFEPNKSEPSRGYMQYVADVYRYIDLKSNDIMRTVDLNILWSDNFGNLYNLFIAPGQYFSVKLLFTLKISVH